MDTITSTRPVSEKQVQFIARLVAERDTSSLEARTAVSAARDAVMAGTLTAQQASAVIDLLLAQPKAQQAPAAGTITEDGMYLLPHTDTHSGRIFKVQRAVHGSGNLYAKELVQTGDAIDDPWVFEYAPGALRLLRPHHKMTLEQAKAFGTLYGTCCVCGRTLTNEESIEAGIGPVCAGRLA